MKGLFWVASAAALGSLYGAQAMAATKAVESKLSPWVIEQMKSEARVPVMVYLKAHADLSPADKMKTKEEKGAYVYRALRDTAASSQADLVTLLKARGADYDQFYITNMVAIYDATAELVAEISQRDDVAKVLGDPTFFVGNEEPANDFVDYIPNGVEPAIVSTGATKVWEEFGAKGKGIVVAGQDTGVDWDHPALKRQYRGNQGGTVSHDYNWYDSIRRTISGTENPCGIATAEPCDDHGHGTHTVGTMVGDDGEGNQVGMAPEAQWIACRNMDNGVGRPTSYIKCFEFFLAPFPTAGDAMKDGKPELAPHVINNSWGCPKEEGCEGSEMVEVVKSLKAAGIVTVVSAGNEGGSCSSIAAQAATHSADTLSVGAHNHKTGEIAFFSSRGPSAFDGGIGPDVTGPGVNIRSAVPGGGYQGGWSGTSMAGPHVAGEVALILSAQPDLIGNVQGVFDLVSTATTPKTSSQTCGGVPGKNVPNNTYGHGTVDVYKAVQAARESK